MKVNIPKHYPVAVLNKPVVSLEIACLSTSVYFSSAVQTSLEDTLSELRKNFFFQISYLSFNIKQKLILNSSKYGQWLEVKGKKVATQLAASQEGLSSMKSVSYMQNYARKGATLPE
jgi:hypothetical protein